MNKKRIKMKKMIEIINLNGEKMGWALVGSDLVAFLFVEKMFSGLCSFLELALLQERLLVEFRTT